MGSLNMGRFQVERSMVVSVAFGRGDMAAVT